MPFDPTLDELAGQSQDPSPASLPRGLPPPQPTPDWFNRDVQQQQRWGLPGAGGQLSDLASRAAGGIRQGWNWLDERAQTAMTGGVSEESVRATDDLLAQMMGWGSMTGAERGALGALRMSRMPPGDKKWALTGFGAEDEWNLHSKETGKKMGELYTTYHPDRKQLHVDYMTTEFPPWEKYNYNAPIDQRSWGIGTHELQTLGPEVLREYPDIDTLKFSRIGGVFKGRPLTLTYKRVTMPDGSIGFERMQTQKRTDRPPWQSPQERQRVAQEQAEARREAVSAAPSSQAGTPTPEPPPPSPASSDVSSPAFDLMPQGAHTTQPETESWDEMRQRQDSEWAALMRRLFGNR